MRKAQNEKKSRGIGLNQRIGGLALRGLLGVFLFLASVFFLKDHIKEIVCAASPFILEHGAAFMTISGVLYIFLEAAVGLVSAMIFATVATRLLIGIAALSRVFKHDFLIGAMRNGHSLPLCQNASITEKKYLSFSVLTL